MPVRPVEVAARSAAAASDTAEIARGTAIAWDHRAGAARAADIVVNATSVGMGGDDSLPIPAEALGREQVIVDLVYEPRATPLLATAAGAGCSDRRRIGMLVHQAALQGRAVERPARARRGDAGRGFVRVTARRSCPAWA